jgi:hypothetical protein
VSAALAVALVGLAGTILTAIVTARATAAKVRSDLEAEYDIALRGERLAAYRELWKMLQPLAKYFRAEPLTYRRLEQLGIALRGWYFDTGGLFLTDRSRDQYFRLLEGLRDELSLRRGEPEAELELRVFAELRERGSALRASLVEEVRTRRPSALESAGS